VDSGRTPGRVIRGHLSNEPSDLGTSARPPGLRFPSPIDPECLTVPGDDGLGPDDYQVLAPPGEAVNDESPEGSVPASQGKVG
jgi:hypothetical protein